MGTCGDLHLMLEERMPLISTDVDADVVGPKTIIERNAYPILVWQTGLQFSTLCDRVQYTCDWPSR